MKYGQQFYSSKDFYLTACLIAAGLNLTSTSKTSQGFLLFHFDCSEKEALDLLDQHWAGLLLLSTKKFVEAIYQLKSRMRLEAGR